MIVITTNFPRTGVQYRHDRHEGTTLFPDGIVTVCEFDKGDNAWYRGIARWAGYRDHRRYAIEHDLTHNWLAETQSRFSPALHRAGRGLPPDHETGCEEYLVNAIQRALRHRPLVDEEVSAILQMPCHDFGTLVGIWRRHAQAT